MVLHLSLSAFVEHSDESMGIAQSEIIERGFGARKPICCGDKFINLSGWLDKLINLSPRLYRGIQIAATVIIAAMAASRGGAT